jgi:hypothetical protein
VVGGIMKNLAEINLQLLDLTEKRQNLIDKTNKNTPAPTTVNNNAIFVGSTAELNKMLQGINNGEK